MLVAALVLEMGTGKQGNAEVVRGSWTGMACFGCFSSQKPNLPPEVPISADASKRELEGKLHLEEKKLFFRNSNLESTDRYFRRGAPPWRKRQRLKSQARPSDIMRVDLECATAKPFTYRELQTATRNFHASCLLGEGGFGRVYKGKLERTGQVVAVKRLDSSGLQGNQEFRVEVDMLSLLHHRNLVNLIGYCADGEQRLLVYEFMPLGCLEDHLHDVPSDKAPLEWHTRMLIACGAAKGLEYLHDKANPPVIYRDFKASNILLDYGFHPKLSDFGLAKLGPVGDKTHVSTRVMGTYGYCAPEYAMTGQLTMKSDIYSFGVVLLELITGRRAIDNNLPSGQTNLVAWARPLFRDRRKFPLMADPLLEGRFPMRGLYQALAVAAMCLQESAAIRPMIADVVIALTHLANQKPFDTATMTPNVVVGHPSTAGKDEREDDGRGEGHRRRETGTSANRRSQDPDTGYNSPSKRDGSKGGVDRVDVDGDRGPQGLQVREGKATPPSAEGSTEDRRAGVGSMPARRRIYGRSVSGIL